MSMTSAANTGSLLRKLMQPGFVVRKTREYGIGRMINDVVGKRFKLPLTFVMAVVRAGRMALRPVDYVASKISARRFVAKVGNPLEIPDSQGYRIVRNDEFPEAAETLAYCQHIVEERGYLLDQHPDSYGINLLTEDGKTWTKKPFDLRQHDKLVNFALNPKLIAAAAAYLGETPALASLQIYCTTSRKTTAGNNLFHFDKQKRSVKFWMAISNIDAEAGPFTFFPAPQSRHIRKNVGYYGRLEDDDIFEAVPKEQQIEFAGPPGSMLLVDTCRCVHFGSRTRKGPRIMLLVEYDSDFAWAESTFYFQSVLYNKDRVRSDAITKRVLKQLRESPPGWNPN